ncbi:MAG: right-handed parallel beta-helix repeat-containing protein [Planctomycetes bacterium]|nr:right-handed parallel beta-helix repeat-containing protein [Planctomycetota bacterium]
MSATLAPLALVACLSLAPASFAQRRIAVADSAALRSALAAAEPGTRIELAADAVFEGDIHAQDVRGESRRPIVITSADPERPGIIRGGQDVGLHLGNAAWVELRDLVVEKAAVNGIHIDDGGPESDTRAEGVLFERVTVRDIGSDGNHDAIKLSGLSGFRVLDCRIERWGTGGSGIDLVGCREGRIAGCTLVHAAGRGVSGIRIRGGSREIVVRACRLENAGARAIQLGGSTSQSFFRPDPDNAAPQRFEAKDLTIEGCTVIGSEAPFACVGVDGAVVRMNTVYRPLRWVLRILQESVEDFVPCRDVAFTRNLFVLDTEVLRRGVNIGPNTDPESFRFEANAWWCTDSSTSRGPVLPAEELRGVHDRRPRFVDETALDLTQHARSPLRKYGTDALR